MIRVDLTDGNFRIPISILAPIDGRYRKQTSQLANYLSEAALNRERIFVEVEWMIALCDGLPASGFDSVCMPQVPGLISLSSEQKEALRQIAIKFNSSSIQQLAEIEQRTKHDVKAIEYFIKNQLEQLKLEHKLSEQVVQKLSQSVHIFCTSEDINNLSYALCIKRAVVNCYLPKLREFVDVLSKLAQEHVNTPMLSKTHGQSATPTTLGKELAVFIHRLLRQIALVEQQEYLGKINGATGTFGAHVVSVPDANWIKFARHFVQDYLHLTYNPITTQIESHDWQVELYDRIAHIGRILHNWATDAWIYISNEIFVQIPEPGATGSSTMPHKINPIKFENAEANLELSDALFSKLSETLPTSRMQRDLTDSTTQRNIGVAFAHALIAITNLIDGTKALEVNREHLDAELKRNPAVLGEAVQSVMRTAGIAGVPNMQNPYERLKEFTRGKEITLEQIHQLICDIGLPEMQRNQLLALTPAKYTGLAEQIAKEVLNS